MNMINEISNSLFVFYRNYFKKTMSRIILLSSNNLISFKILVLQFGIRVLLSSAILLGFHPTAFLSPYNLGFHLRRQCDADMLQATGNRA